MRDSYERRGALYSSGVESSSSLLGVRLRPLSSRMLGALYSSMRTMCALVLIEDENKGTYLFGSCCSSELLVT